MKQCILLFVILIISLPIFSQGYFGASINKKGVGFQSGFLAGKIDLNAGITFPVTSTTAPTTYNLSAGFMINITQEDEDNFSVTPSVGFGVVNQRVLIKAHQYNPKYGTSLPYESYRKVSTGMLFSQLEIAKDSHMGRVFISGCYTDEVKFSVGMKVFLSR